MTIASLIRNVLPAILSGHEQDAVALLEWPLFDEVQMRPVIFDLAALFLRLFLLAKDYRKARHVLEALPPHFYSNRQVLLSLVNDPQFGPFAKEIFYYRQLVDLLTAYEQWAMAYAEARSLLGEHENTEVVLGNFKFQTDQFCMDALKFLQADWLSDVETAACQFVDSSREDELLRLREIYISEIIVLLVAILKLPEAPSDLVVEALEILADPEYEYWNELASQKQLDTVLYTLRSYGKLDERMSNAIERLAAHIRR